MGYAWNALSYQERVTTGSTTRVLGLSLVFVFLILAALYESWTLPFSVLLSTPIAVLGAFLGMLSRHLDNNVYTQIGLIVLVGLTAKNAILIVEFAKDGYEQGKPLIDAALEAAKLRLRPILMTSFAFILGCLPLWFASGAGAAARIALGTAVITGMLLATLVGIFFIPALFVMTEKLRKKKPASAPPPAPHSS
jgi:HAE1 family hydrophobic/amphiphilic exporter-1